MIGPASEAIRSACAQIIDVSDAAGPQVAPIRIRRAHDRAVVIVQHREGVGQRVVIWNVRRASSRTSPSGPSAIAQLSYCPEVPGSMGTAPAVVGSGEIGEAEAVEPGLILCGSMRNGGITGTPFAGPPRVP